MLFDEITRLPEYYPTRTERAILEAHAGAIAQITKADTLVELGSGTSEKTRILLDALRDGDLLILTSDHGCDPTTPSTDHSREYALLLAYVQGRNAAGLVIEDGEFGDVGATVNAWLGGSTPPKKVLGKPLLTP